MSYVHNSKWHEDRLERQWPGCSTDSERIASSVEFWRKAGERDMEKIPVLRIIDAVCEAYKVNRGELLGPGRSIYIRLPRFHAVALAIDLRPDMSLTALARIFHRDHSTLINARNQWFSTWGGRKAAHIAAVNAILFNEPSTAGASWRTFSGVVSLQDAEPMVG